MSGIAKYDDIKNRETSVCKLKLLFANSCFAIVSDDQKVLNMFSHDRKSK